MSNPATPNLSLPLIAPSQAQKHVTHNEALSQLDLLAQLTVQSFAATTPPDDATEGAVYALGPTPQGAWAGQPLGTLAAFLNAGWVFVTPKPGWQGGDATTGDLRSWDGTAWVPLGAPSTLPQLGINASADTTNRLSVNSDSTLLNHDGASHQLKINKANDTDTASLLFQSNWAGHAEMGLAGQTDWSIKVSPDGTTWSEALRLNAATGLASGEAIQATPEDTTPGRLMRADYGYGPGNLVGPLSQSGGTPTGSVLESGSNANGSYTRWADGTQMCWAQKMHTDVPISTVAGGCFRSPIFYEDFPMPFTAEPVVTLSGTRASDTWDVWAIIHQISSTQFSLLHMKLVSDTSQDRTLSYIAMGRWF